jgi:hypothetical protein
MVWRVKIRADTGCGLVAAACPSMIALGIGRGDVLPWDDVAPPGVFQLPSTIPRKGGGVAPFKPYFLSLVGSAIRPQFRTDIIRIERKQCMRVVLFVHDIFFI